MNIKVDHFFHYTPDSSGAILALLHTLVTQGVQIMATQQEFEQKLTDLQAAVDAAEARADARDAALQQKLTDLQTAFDALKNAAPDIPQTLVDKVDASITDLNEFAVSGP